MRRLVLVSLASLSSFFGLCTFALAQECPWQDSQAMYNLDWQSRERMSGICEAIGSFNREGVPGIVIADDSDDDCDDEDPTWMPTPPYSALISAGPNNFYVQRLSEREEQDARDAFGYRVFDEFRYNHRPPSFREASPTSIYALQDVFRRMAQSGFDARDGINRDTLVYFFLRQSRY